MKKTLSAATAALAVMLGAQAAQAGSDVGSTYVAPMITASWLDDSRVADDDSGFAFAVGGAVAEKWNVELLLSNASHSLGAGQKLKLQGLEVAAQRLFYRDARVSPFLSLGLGRLESRAPGSKSGDLYLKYGAGVLGDLRKNTEAGTNLQLRAELFGRRVDSDLAGASDLVDYVAGLGVQYSWGGQIAPKTVPDSDGDGVPDDLDKCPDTPPGTPVDASGCPLDKDSDGDGVMDSRDKCPDTPAGAKVNEDGCELDTDGDGVVDSKDKCPGTPPQTKVDSNGCECGDIVLRGVTFVTGKADITPQGQLILDSVISGLAQRTGAKIEIRGHTDDVGAENANMALSERRAEAVKAYMVGKGLDPANLTTIGLGEMQHLAPNDSPEGREQNRRVTLQILSVICEERASEDLVLRGVTFASGSSRITPTSRLVLDSAVQYLKARPTASVEVRGHTDDVGSEQLNMQLSQARAESVRDYLADAGIESGRLKAVGLGETDHLGPNDTAEQRAQNRRVTLRIQP